MSMPRRFKVVSVNRINNCCPSYATKATSNRAICNMQYATSNMQQAIVNERKRKSSRIHVLCDDLVLFRLRSKKLSPVCNGTGFLFVESNRSENQFQENLHTSNRTNDAKTEGKDYLASFCAQWTQNRGPKPLQKLRGAAKLLSKNLGFWRLRRNAFSRYERTQ